MRCWIAPVVFLVGCGPSYPELLAVQRAREQVLSETPMFKHMCSDGRVGKSCGIVTPHYVSSEYRSWFVQAVCHNEDGEPCKSRFQRMVFARLRERYRAADWVEVNEHCDGYPLDCDTLPKVERVVQSSHNGNVQRRVSEAESGAAARARQDQQERSQNVAAAMRAFGTAMQGGTVCHTRTNGTVSTTTCNK